MSTPSSGEFAANPSLGQQLTDRIDQKFAKLGSTPRGFLERAHEQSLRLLPTTELDECPTPQVVMLTRPIPGEEQQAAERWRFGGPRIRVSEANGRIQTIYRAVGDEIVKRRTTHFPYEDSPRPGEKDIEHLLQHTREQLGNALAIAAMDSESAAEIVRKRAVGEPIDDDEAQRLFTWMDGMLAEGE